MTGGEIVPIGKVAADVAKKTLETDDPQKEQLRELAHDLPEMRTAAEQYAKRVAIKQRLLLRLYQPLAKWAGVSKSYFETDFGQDMAEKIADIPDENLTSPRPSVAVPAMQGLGYSLDEPDLKEMYLNLLATATDDRTEESAHPSFAEVIRQLSGPEAKLLATLMNGQVRPIVRIIATNVESKGSNVIFDDVWDIQAPDGSPTFVAKSRLWLNNWVRLGLVSVDYSRHLTRENAYEWVEGRPELAAAKDAITDGRSVDFDKGIVTPTAFGVEFMSAVGAREANG